MMSCDIVKTALDALNGHRASRFCLSLIHCHSKKKVPPFRARPMSIFFLSFIFCRHNTHGLALTCCRSKSMHKNRSKSYERFALFFRFALQSYIIFRKQARFCPKKCIQSPNFFHFGDQNTLFPLTYKPLGA
jgi:hypothetical protein